MDKLTLKLPKPYISASQVSTWTYNKGQYVDRYIFNIPTYESPELLFGSRVSKLMEKGKWGREKKELRAVLDKLIRYKIPEYKLEATFTTKKGEFNFLGYMDSYDIVSNRILEYKTGRTIWDQKRANEHFQTMIYAAVIFNATGRIPKVWIQWIPTRQENGVSVPVGKVHTFKVDVTVGKMVAALKKLKKVALEINEWYIEYLDGIDEAAKVDDETEVPKWVIE